MNEREVTALLERRATAVPTSDPPIDEILEAGRRGPRRYRHRNAFLAAAAVLALIVGAGVSWDAARDESSPAPPTETPSLPAHEGYRWVGMNGVAVEVPASWTTSDSFCARASVDTVVFGYYGPDTCQDPRVDPRASSLHFETLDSRNFIAEMAPADAQHQVSIGGLPALLTDPVELNCPRPVSEGCRSVLGSSVEIDSPDAHFLLVWIESPDRAIVENVISSMRLVPEGSVAVPSLTGMPQSKAADTLGRLGLHPTSLCPDGAPACDGSLEVLQTDPLAGTVVTQGSTVDLLAARDGTDASPPTSRTNVALSAAISPDGRLTVTLTGSSDCGWAARGISKVGSQHVAVEVASTGGPDCTTNLVPWDVPFDLPPGVGPDQPVIVDMHYPAGSSAQPAYMFAVPVAERGAAYRPIQESSR